MSSQVESRVAGEIQFRGYDGIIVRGHRYSQYYNEPFQMDVSVLASPAAHAAWREDGPGVLIIKFSSHADLWDLPIIRTLLGLTLRSAKATMAPLQSPAVETEPWMADHGEVARVLFCSGRRPANP